VSRSAQLQRDSGRRVKDAVELGRQLLRRVIQNTVAVVEAADYKGCTGSLLCLPQCTMYVPQLSQLKVTGAARQGNVACKLELVINMYSETTSRRLQVDATNHRDVY